MTLKMKVSPLDISLSASPEEKAAISSKQECGDKNSSLYQAPNPQCNPKEKRVYLDAGLKCREQKATHRIY